MTPEKSRSLGQRIRGYAMAAGILLGSTAMKDARDDSGAFNPIPEPTPTPALVVAPRMEVKTPVPTPESTLSRESVEKQFNIQLSTLPEEYLKKGKSQEDLVKDYRASTLYKPDEKLEWTGKRLELLTKYISSLPPHFYAPDEKGNKLLLILGYEPNSMDAKSTNFPRNVQISVGHFVAEDPLSFPYLAHEMTHILIPPNKSSQEVQKALGVSFPQILPELQQKLRQASPLSGGAASLNARDLMESRFYYGLLDEKGNEFLPVATESYIKGKWQFYRVYLAALSPGQVDTLYNYMKESVFKGKEYNPN